MAEQHDIEKLKTYKDNILKASQDYLVTTLDVSLITKDNMFRTSGTSTDDHKSWFIRITEKHDLDLTIGIFYISLLNIVVFIGKDKKNINNAIKEVERQMFYVLHKNIDNLTINEFNWYNNRYDTYSTIWNIKKDIPYQFNKYNSIDKFKLTSHGKYKNISLDELVKKINNLIQKN